MSGDDEQDESTRKFVDEWSARVSAGEPIWGFQMHEILSVQITPEGAALIDFVFAKAPDNRATVARLLVTTEATRALKAALVANESIPDTPPTARDPRSTQ